jgi:hypothetical protein
MINARAAAMSEAARRLLGLLDDGRWQRVLDVSRANQRSKTPPTRTCSPGTYGRGLYDVLIVVRAAEAGTFRG